ncbi:ABC transporter ATP-binding protein [Paenibacillus glucanolyticus]|uniref:ABC transporter ATP-binding protein n=1 Tax=Paenibacillus glucanolyticus TaxID=59843 RepID=UPI000D1B4919|nr:ABC transporter ATP-binding protein [Paenibacillus glucanolyticus]AVV56411.1 ABC transporter ATP-binding protein [Paenibacillus glucanolyticus]MPY19851.1 ABC transporter ATP-binding protein [Paenibacillus glucanolyticus]
MNIRRARKIIEKTYTDRAIIQRYEDYEEGSETKQRLITKYQDEPCRISQTGLARNGQTEAENQIDYDAKLFISPDIEILQGDELEVTRKGRKYKFTAGEPFPPYSTHQEINLTRKDRA